MLKLSSFSLLTKNYEIYLTGLFRKLSSDPKPEGWENAKPYESIPGPKPLPIIGNAWRYFIGLMRSLDFNKIQEMLHDEFGDICVVRKQITMPDMVYVYHPVDIEKFIRHEGKWPEREGFISGNYYRNVVRKDIFGDKIGVLSSHGKMWHEIRLKVNPVFMQPLVAKQYVGSMNSVASDFLENVKILAGSNELGEMPENFLNELNKWAFESIGVVALDRRLGCIDKNPNPEAEKMVKYMCEIFQMMYVFDFTPLGRYFMRFNAPMWRKFVEYEDYFTNMTLKYLDETEEKIKTSNEYLEKSESEKSVFEKLLKIDKKLAMVTTLDTLGAGIDSTGKTTAAALYLLAKNVEVQNKLRQELLEVMPTPETPITVEILNNVPYLKAVIKEVGRMAPIAAAHMRRTTKDLVLCGYQIPSGTTLMAPTLFLSTNINHYKRPKEFLPERWLKTTIGDLSYKNVNPFITIPFGFGPRACIGQRFANLEMEIIIAKIIRNFKLSWPHPDMKFGQDLLHGIKDPLKLHLQGIY